MLRMRESGFESLSKREMAMVALNAYGGMALNAYLRRWL